MSSNCLSISAYNFDRKDKRSNLYYFSAHNFSNDVSFKGRPSNYISAYTGQKLKTASKNFELGPLMVYMKDAVSCHKYCYEHDVSVQDFFEGLMGMKKFIPQIEPMPSVTHKILKSNMQATSLMDGGQIFNKTLADIDGARKSIQIKMFEFQNLTVDGDDWLPLGAEKVPGYEEQRKLLEHLITKRRSNPGMKIQVMLDVHKWGINSTGTKKHYNNQKMIAFLKKNGIDIVPAPRDSILNHEKYMIVDGEKAIIGGMNWGTHSPANHDFCFELEKLKRGQPSEIDNLMQDFNESWTFAWQRIGTKRLVSGPLNEQEQKLFHGIRKEIKPENVSYAEIMKPYFETPEAMNRYSEGRLDLIDCHPIKNPTIKFLTTRPDEYKEIGAKGSESIGNYVQHELETCKEVYGELFYFTDKDLIKTLIKRVHAGELKARFVINDMDFPHCKEAYYDLMKAGIDVRRYKGDSSINQRMHAKWMIFDNKRILVGSPNMSKRATRQNIGKGFRGDYKLTAQKLDSEIKELFKEVKQYEKALSLPSFKWTNTKESFEAFKKYRRMVNSAYKKLNETGEAKIRANNNVYEFTLGKSTFKMNDTEQPITKVNDKKTTDELFDEISGLYEQIFEKQHNKEIFSRGNSESAIVFESSTFVNEIFRPQFMRDYVFSEPKYLKLHKKKAEYIPPKPFNVQG